MPSFLLFRDDEVGAIVEYVRWLSMRGEFEQKVDVEFEAEQYSSDAISQRRKGGESEEQIDAALAKFIGGDLPRIASDKADDLVTSWNAAEQPDALVLPKKARHARQSRVARTRPQAVRLRHRQVLAVPRASRAGRRPADRGLSDHPRLDEEILQAGTVRRLGPSDQAARPDVRYLPRGAAAAGHLPPHLCGDQGDADAPLRRGPQG